MTQAPPRLFCFGLGYTAAVLARRLSARGWRIAGTCREQARLEALTAEGFEMHRFDEGVPLDDPGARLAGTTHLLASVPPRGEGGDDAADPVLAAHGAAIAAIGGLRWLGYLSTTGVYGDRGGGWVTEDSELAPTGRRGRRRLEAETEWLAQQRRHGLPVHLFRLAGIYGPGRSQLDSVASGKARRIVKPGQVFSRIHVEDIATVLEASMARPNPGAAYNVCDDEAADPAEVIAYAAGLLDLPPPPAIPFETAELSAMARSFYRDNKRVSNRRIKQELGVELRYPNYRAGLAALDAERRPRSAG